jgi:hypothetical protein
MDTFPDADILIKLNQEHRNHLNRSITRMKSKQSLNKEKPRAKQFHSQILLDIYRRINTMLLKLLHKIDREGVTKLIPFSKNNPDTKNG